MPDTQVAPIQQDARFVREAPPRAAASRALQHAESRRVVKYGIVGVLNVTIDFALYALLLSLGVWYVAAKTLSLVAATTNGYTWNRLWTFRAGRHRNETLAKYVGVQVFCLAFNLALLALLVEVLDQDELVAQAIAFPVVAAASFLGNRLWTFGRHLGAGR